MPELEGGVSLELLEGLPEGLGKLEEGGELLDEGGGLLDDGGELDGLGGAELGVEGVLGLVGLLVLAQALRNRQMHASPRLIAWL